MANFAQQMKRWAESTNRTLDKTITDAVRGICTQIIVNTPVGAPPLWKSAPPADYFPGTLVNNWFSNITGPVTQASRGENTRGSASFQEMEAAVSLAPGNVFYFTNPTVYARRIEFGHSTQAPQGMVRLAVVDFSNMLAKAARKNRK